MSDLARIVRQKAAAGEKLLSIYLPAGFPNPQATPALLDAIVEAGADMIELGVPFSDPLADGPTIQEAAQTALAAGTTLQACLDLAAAFRQKHQTPLLLMGYGNPFMRYGWQEFIKAAAEAGVSGLIIPDLPPEESGEVHALACERDMDVVFLVSPNTSPDRVQSVAKLTTAFIYAVSITGVTGARSSLPASTVEFLQRLQEATAQPCLVGFGVSSAASAQALAAHCAGVIIGSAMVKCIQKAEDTQAACDAVYSFVSEIKQVLGETA